MSWLHLCVFFLYFISLKASQCPSGPQCTSCNLVEDPYIIICNTIAGDSGFNVYFKPNKSIEILCENSPDWSEFFLGTTGQIQYVKTLIFSYCSLPEKSQLGAIQRQLLVNDVEELVFLADSVKESLNLTRENLLDFQGIKRLSLSSNNLVNVTTNLLHDFKDLTELDLSSSHIKKFPDNFLALPNLQKIKLSGNMLQIIEPSLFDKLKSLEHLSIWKNEITEVKPNAFDNSISLVQLDLHLNKLQALPPDIFTRLWKLEDLDLSQNNFSEMALSTGLLHKNKNIKNVNLFMNGQRLTLPNQFFLNLTKLETVKIFNNGFTSLPEDLFLGTTGLINLNIGNNLLATLPPNIFHDCKNLSKIQIGSNKIHYLPDSVFSGLSNLQELDLSNNQIEAISKNLLDSLYSLTMLKMEHNDLKTIDANGLMALQNLHFANFSNNQLTLRDEVMNENKGKMMSPFKHTKNIEELDLSFNNISNIFSDWIQSNNLSHLNLEGNKIKIVSDKDLRFMSKGIIVNLEYNGIQKILLERVGNATGTEDYSKSGKIYISNNPLMCDCDIYNLTLYLGKKMFISGENSYYLEVKHLLCKEPIWYKDVPVETLSSEGLICLVSEPQMRNATCPQKCSCTMRPEYQAYIINCSYKGFTAAPTSIKPPSGYHIEIDLTGNYLKQMPIMSQPGYDNVTALLLAHNQIENVPLEALSKNLKVLNLHNNKLAKIGASVLDFLNYSVNLTNLTLHQNPWVCNCENLDFLNFLQKTNINIINLQNITCGSRNLSIIKMIPEELCSVTSVWMIAGCIGVALLGITIGSLAALYYRYQHEIKVWLYARQWCLWWVTENELDKDKIYDAFISYSHKDEDFVVNNLVAKLESGPRPFKLCVHYRDWPAGEWISNQVARSVANSRRTVVVLSNNFLESVWGKMEFRTAHSQALNEGRARVIVIIFGDIPRIDTLDSELQAYLSTNTYVKWGDLWFWDKLRYALPHPILLKSQSTQN